MHRLMCKGKIHRATVTEANLDYPGSITIDQNLMQAANNLFEAYENFPENDSNDLDYFSNSSINNEDYN